MLTHTANIQTDLITLEADMTTTETTEAERKRLADEQAKREAKDQQTRYAANAKAEQILINFVRWVGESRPTRKEHGIGPQLEAIIERAIEDMGAYFHDHLRDHYDARKDV